MFTLIMVALAAFGVLFVYLAARRLMGKDDAAQIDQSLNRLKEVYSERKSLWQRLMDWLNK